MLEATDTNGYDTDHSETESDIEPSEDRKCWDPVYNAYMSKGASSSTSKKIVLEFNTNTNCNKISNDTEDKSPSTKSDPLGDRETDLILHKTEARHYAQIGNKNTDYPVGDFDNKLGKHGSGSTERKATVNQTKFTEGDNIWNDPAVDKDRKGRHPDNRQRKTFRLNQGFFYQTNDTIPCNWEMCLSKKY